MYKRKTFFLILLFLGFFTLYQQQFIRSSSIYLKNYLINILLLKQVEAGLQNTTQVNKDLKLELTNLIDGMIVHNELIQIKGVTVLHADVFINQKELKVDEKGNFSTIINLDEGENSLFFVVNDEDGNYVEKEIRIILETLIP